MLNLPPTRPEDERTPLHNGPPMLAHCLFSQLLYGFKILTTTCYIFDFRLLLLFLLLVFFFCYINVSKAYNLNKSDFKNWEQNLLIIFDSTYPLILDFTESIEKLANSSAAQVTASLTQFSPKVTPTCLKAKLFKLAPAFITF